MLEKLPPHSHHDDPELMDAHAVPARKAASDGVRLEDYYAAVAPLMLPHVKDRPLQIGRVSAHGVAPDPGQPLPDFVSLLTMPDENGTSEGRYLLCQNTQGLASLGAHLTGTLFGWNSRFDKPQLPDVMVIDLNPPDVTYTEELAEAAFLVKAILEEGGMLPYVMTTGSRGLHVVCPLRRNRSFERVHGYLSGVAQEAAKRRPRLVTSDGNADRQGEKIILDLGGNTYGKACVVPYAVRDMEHGPVAAPLTWEELEASDFHPQRFTVATMEARLKKRGNVWENFFRHKRKLMK